MSRKRYFILALGLLLTLTACGPTPAEPESEPDDALTRLRETISAAGAVAGAAYLGPWSGDPVFPADYPSLPTDTTVTHEGSQLFCLVPGREGDTLTVRAFTPTQLSHDQGEPGDLLYGGDGQPILLVCSLSQVMPNTEVIFTTEDGRETSFTPALGMCDGRLSVPADGSIYDFTSYETPTADGPAPVFLGNWIVGDALLVFQPDGTMEYHREDSLLTGTFYVIDENAHYPPGSVVFEMGSFWGIFSIQPEGGTIAVTHLTGDPLMEGMETETLIFVKE